MAMLSFISGINDKYTSLAENVSGLNQSPNMTYKLLFQIVILQLFYYFTAMLTFGITSALSGWDFHLGLVLSWSDVSMENTFGLTLMFLWLLNALFSVGFIAFIIGRSKLVWDFVITIHFFNLVLVWLVNGFPKNMYWWILQISSSLIMTILGVFMTRWVELRDTFFENMTDIEMGSSIK